MNSRGPRHTALAYASIGFCAFILWYLFAARNGPPVDGPQPAPALPESISASKSLDRSVEIDPGNRVILEQYSTVQVERSESDSEAPQSVANDPQYSDWTRTELGLYQADLKLELQALVDQTFAQMRLAGDYKITWDEIATWDGFVRSPGTSGTVLYSMTITNPEEMKTPLDATSVPTWHLWITREKHVEIAAIIDEIEKIDSIMNNLK